MYPDEIDRGTPWRDSDENILRRAGVLLGAVSTAEQPLCNRQTLPRDGFAGRGSALWQPFLKPLLPTSASCPVKRGVPGPGDVGCDHHCPVLCPLLRLHRYLRRIPKACIGLACAASPSASAGPIRRGSRPSAVTSGVWPSSVS